jgi:hypothetical protein
MMMSDEIIWSALITRIHSEVSSPTVCVGLRRVKCFLGVLGPTALLQRFHVTL